MYQVIVSPSGTLRCHEVSGPPSLDERLLKKMAPVFDKEGEAAGLFAFGALKKNKALSSISVFWHEFAVGLVSQLCHTPEIATQLEPLIPPLDTDFISLHLGLPPMIGAEYVTAELLRQKWDAMEQWVRVTVPKVGGLEAFIVQYAPHWHQVGRVCFHLAENKSDPEYPFAFMATYASGFTKAGQLAYLPIAKALQEYAGMKNKRALIKLLSPVSVASRKSSFVKDLVDSGDIYHPFPLIPDEAYCFLSEVSIYEESGLLVRLPNWWRKRPRAKVSISLGNQTSKSFSINSILDFSIDIAIGGQSLTESEVEAMLASEENLQFIKGQWVEVNREKLEQALAHWREIRANTGDGLGLIQAMRLLAGGGTDLNISDADEEVADWSVVSARGGLKQTLEALRNPKKTADVHPGKALKATLRHYQSDGVKWLRLLQQLGLGACLADDMGLGKTIQVISLLLMLKKEEAGTSLLIVPASLLSNWQHEITKFGPSLRFLLLHTSQIDRKIRDSFLADIHQSVVQYDLIITTYSMAYRMEALHQVQWQVVILDEAQAIKNPSSQQARAVKKIPARSRIAMTGTPVENRLSDLWSLFDFLNPGLLGTMKRFKEFVKKLETREKTGYLPLRNLISPYILRRLKTDKRVITELPEKTEIKAFCLLSKMQASIYQDCVLEMKHQLESADGMARRGLVLSYLMRFKQICNHPSQGKSGGIFDPSHSGKFLRLKELSEEIASRQEKMLVFTQFREMTEPLSTFLETCFGQPGLTLHGGTPVKKRMELVERFQHEDGPPFFVLSLKAGGTGLNLTAANHVVHFDRWWNPAVENQATDRAFRIGQKNNVLVHKFIVQGTLEEKIDMLIEEKTQLSGELLEDRGRMMLTEMKDEELLNLIKLDIGKT